MFKVAPLYGNDFQTRHLEIGLSLSEKYRIACIVAYTVVYSPVMRIPRPGHPALNRKLSSSGIEPTLAVDESPDANKKEK